jgi:hypothetical protein
MSEKTIARYIRQAVVERRVFEGFGSADSIEAIWWDSEVEYSDGSREVVREVSHLNLRTGIISQPQGKAVP